MMLCEWLYRVYLIQSQEKEGRIKYVLAIEILCGNPT